MMHDQLKELADQLLATARMLTATAMFAKATPVLGGQILLMADSCTRWAEMMADLRDKARVKG